MTYFKDVQAYVHQSMLLLSARPSTTRITTTFTSGPAATSSSMGVAEEVQPVSRRAVLTLKTYDPVSGATLKFRTDKASEVGRLMTGLRRCGRQMAALPETESGAGYEGSQAMLTQNHGQEAEQKDGPHANAPTGQSAKTKRRKGRK